MTELSNEVSRVFVSGLSREKFIENYKHLSESGTNNSLIFNHNFSDSIIGTIYDSFHADATSNSTNEDVMKLASFDGDATSISDKDIIALYEKTYNTLKSSNVSVHQENSDELTITPLAAMDIISALQDMKIEVANSQMSQINSEIDELVNNSEDLPEEFKLRYNDERKEFVRLQKQARIVEKNLYEAESEERNIKFKIIVKTNQADNSMKLETKNEYLAELSRLSTELYNTSAAVKRYSNELASMNRSIDTMQTKINESLEEIQDLVPSLKPEISARLTQIDDIDVQHKNEIMALNREFAVFQEQNEKICQQSGKQAGHYSNIADQTEKDEQVSPYAAKALSRAFSQIGVQELTKHNDGAEIVKYRNGVDDRQPWCASFVSWAYKGNDVFGYTARVSDIKERADAKGLYSKKEDYTPKPGDIMIQKEYGASHCGVVHEVKPDGTIVVIEGNSSDMVRSVNYVPGKGRYKLISGWVRMSECGQQS